MVSITGISYSKIHKNGERSELWTDSNALVQNFITNNYINEIYTPNFYTLQEGFFYLPEAILRYSKQINRKYDNLLNSLRMNHNHSHPFKFVKKYESHVDYMIFYMSDHPEYSVNTHINLINTYEKFYEYFIDHSSSIINELDKNPIVKPVRLKSNSNPFEDNQRKLGFSTLSNQEFRLIFDILEGRSSKENTIGVSAYTAESYLKSIKNKLGVNKKEQIVAHYYEWKYHQNHNEN